MEQPMTPPPIMATSAVIRSFHMPKRSPPLTTADHVHDLQLIPVGELGGGEVLLSQDFPVPRDRNHPVNAEVLNEVFDRRQLRDLVYLTVDFDLHTASAHSPSRAANSRAAASGRAAATMPETSATPAAPAARHS